MDAVVEEIMQNAKCKMQIAKSNAKFKMQIYDKKKTIPKECSSDKYFYIRINIEPIIFFPC